jgi:hypothetical protein
VKGGGYGKAAAESMKMRQKRLIACGRDIAPLALACDLRRSKTRVE